MTLKIRYSDSNADLFPSVFEPLCEMLGMSPFFWLHVLPKLS